MTRLVQGPSDDFWQVWLRYRPELFKWGLRLMSGNQADAEDALSVALLRAREVFPRQAQAITDKRAWLRRLVRNICIDMHRARQRFDSSPAEELISEECVPEPTPEERFLQLQLGSQLAERVDELRVALREPFRMRFVQGLSYDEISARMGLTNCNTRKRIQLACKELRCALAPELSES